MFFKISLALGFSLIRQEELAIYKWMDFGLDPASTTLIMIVFSTISLIFMFGFTDKAFQFLARFFDPIWENAKSLFQFLALSMGPRSEQIKSFFRDNGKAEARARKLLAKIEGRKNMALIFFFLSLIPFAPFVAPSVVASKLIKLKYGFRAIWLGSSIKVVYLVYTIFRLKEL